MFVPATTTLLPTGDLSWESEGYFLFGSEDWKNNTIKAKFTYNGDAIGLLPRIASEKIYIAFTVGNNIVDDDSIAAPLVSTGNAVMSVQLHDNTIYLATKEIPLLNIGRDYEVSVKVFRNNYKAYLNGTLIFNVDNSIVSTGKQALYSSIGNSCSVIEVIGPIPDGWASNVTDVNMGTVSTDRDEKGDLYIYIENPFMEKDLFIQQVSTVKPSADYTLSFRYKGEGKVWLKEEDGTGSGFASIELEKTEEWTRKTLSIKSSADASKISTSLIAHTDVPVCFDKIQFEEKAFSTSYVKNDSLSEAAKRTSSYITYPANKNIYMNEGGITLWVMNNVESLDSLDLKPVIFEYGKGSDIIRLYLEKGALTLRYKDRIKKTNTLLPGHEWDHIAINWNGTNADLWLNGKLLVFTHDDIASTESVETNVIRLSHSEVSGYDIFDGAIDELSIYSKRISEDRIEKLFLAQDGYEDKDGILLHSSFDYEVIGMDHSIIEMTPAPLYGSPVIVNNEMDEVLNKVSYFDTETGEFRPFNEEKIRYDKNLDFIQIGYLDIETEKFVTQVKDSEGSIIGEPYRFEGQRIYLTLSDAEKKRLHRSYLTATYQPRNPYTVDFNIGVVDSFRVGLGKHDGTNVAVTYEGNRFSEEKLATMIELNPMMNPNHEGFLYITNNKQEVSSFRVQASPYDMSADGISESLVSIEPLDSIGDFISNVSLSVTAKEGSVIPSLEPGSVKLREIAGRFIYKYRAPLIRLSERKKPEITDYINIIDKKSGMGVQIPITLSIYEEYDVDKGISLEEQNWEKIAAYILDKVMDYFKKDISKMPTGLGELLDLDGDGSIDLNEIIWLNDNKFSQEIYEKYIAIRQWYNNK